MGRNGIKVCHVTTVDSSLRYLLLNQLRALRESGYTVVAVSSPGCEVPVLASAGIRHIAVPMTRRAVTPVSDLCSLWRLWRVFRRERFEIVHTHTPKAGILGRLAAKLAGVPVIVHTSHGFLFHEGSHPLWRALFTALEAVAARCCDLIFSVNREDITSAIDTGICDAHKILLLSEGGIGLDLLAFDPDGHSQSDKMRLRRELGLLEGAPVVGFVGRLVREKGLLELLAAARLVRERVPQARLLIVGESDKEKPDALGPASAEGLDVADVCIFAGLRHDMPALYSLMDVLVLPSHREGFPRAPMEASAMGIPCVVTDVRGCREVIEHNSNGLVVPCHDVLALAEAIVELLTNNERARRMGQRGRRLAVERFDERLVFQNVDCQYMRLLRQKGCLAGDADEVRRAHCER